jgi:hypothetical protein
MSTNDKPMWWQNLPAHIGGDVIIADVGSNSQGIAVGKNITQTIYGLLGEPTPEDRQVVQQEIASLSATLQDLRGQLDEKTADMAQFQVEILEGELTKTEEEQVPSGTTITKIGDWLLENVPEIAEVLAGLFATPAVGRVVGKAGELAVKWVKERFGRES